MNTHWPQLKRVAFDENEERLKITLPVQRNWLLLSLYSVLMLVWLAALVAGVASLFSGVPGSIRGQVSGLGFAVYVAILLGLAYVWWRLGGHIAYWWQYYLANREILFIEKKRLIVRRPVSIFGVTDAYDMGYVSPFFYSEPHGSPAFRYGNKGILFGQGLEQGERQQLLGALNARYFPAREEDDEA